jgi:hypothetical protein
VEELRAKRIRPFAVIAVVLVVVCIAVARLPESFVEVIQRRSPFTFSQGGWAYRLLAFAAIAQAAYGGFVLLRPSKVQRARSSDPKLARVSRAKLTSLVAHTAASMITFTLAYGIAAFAVTGQRGGFWLFPVIAVAQGAWYYREVGQIAGWIGFQKETEIDDRSRGAWVREGPDYCPPIARGLQPVSKGTPVSEG